MSKNLTIGVLEQQNNLGDFFNVGATRFGVELTDAPVVEARLTYGIIDNDYIWLTGSFQSYQNFTSPGLIKLDLNGNIASNWNIGTGFENIDQLDGVMRVEHINKLPNGKYLISGMFDRYQGDVHQNYVVINDDGSVWEDWTPVINNTSLCQSLPYVHGNQIYIRGVDNFNSMWYNGQQTSPVSRINLNGTLDTSFSLNVSVTRPPHSPVLYNIFVNDNWIYCTGHFTEVNGRPCGGLFRVDHDGDLDIDFDIKVGANYIVTKAIETADGIYALGDFTSWGGVTGNNRIIRLNQLGEKDTGFNNSTGFNSMSFEGDIIEGPNNTIYVAGSHNTYKWFTSRGLIRILNTGFVDTAFDTAGGFKQGRSPGRSSLFFDGVGKLLVVGAVRNYKEVPYQTGAFLINNNGDII